MYGENETCNDAACLSAHMNAIPPSKDYFCVGNGPSNLALHPDRAPHTTLAEQDGVILFSGTAPQQGLNFSLSAGSLVYRNQMSTLGSPEPSPQVGAAGALRQRPWQYFLPWSEARWHPGEDITWQGHRANIKWLGGLPFWDYPADYSSDYCKIGAPQNATGEACTGGVYRPKIKERESNGWGWGLHSSINLQLSRGIYQASKVRDSFQRPMFDEDAESFREPWFQGRGSDPAFNIGLSTPHGDTRLAQDYFPNFHNIYTYQKLDLDGGRLVIDFERSATWPRELDFAGMSAAVSGTSMAARVADEYRNRVEFDRVPQYGWETDYKVPRGGAYHAYNDPSFSALPPKYRPTPQAWRLPHKRLRTVKLYDADAATAADGGNDDPAWTLVFIYEHPESDRISATDTGPWNSNPNIQPSADPSELWRQWKSLYSDLPQEDWSFGRLPELNDETTLLTVQAYKTDAVPDVTLINGAPFQDDYSVWGSHRKDNETTLVRELAATARVNMGIEYVGDHNGDGCPGICGVDDDGDGLIDEDCDAGPCPDDDNEDGIVEWQVGNDWHGVTDRGSGGSDPAGDVTTTLGLNCPGLCGIDDDGDGLIDEDTNGQMAYLAVTPTECSACQTVVSTGSTSTACNDDDLPDQTHINMGCPNPLYWRGRFNASGQWTCDVPCIPMDPFASWDDDEDGLIDEDDENNPLLVNIRAIPDTDECASGKHPFMPKGATLPNGSVDEHCRPAIATTEDPATEDRWTHQVQYVYARSNPYWLLSARNADGTMRFLNQPQYYYFPPFSPDIDGDGTDDLLYDEDHDGVYDQGTDVLESDIPATGTGPFSGMVVDSVGDADGLPNVHPDCVPDPDYRGDQGQTDVSDSSETVEFAPTQPSDIHLIKRIVRTRPDVDNDPAIYTEHVWLYRYNDQGFLKAVFDPPAVQALLDADDRLQDPDDILKYADTETIGPTGEQRPLITFASQWYTYYNPYMNKYLDEEGERDWPGIPPCYDDPPLVDEVNPDVAFLDPGNPLQREPANACDGQYVWDEDYADEQHIDPDCSDYIRQDCGWCLARNTCYTHDNLDPSTRPVVCHCYDGLAADPAALLQMGIPGAQPRFRKHMIKTARVRGDDGEMHLYRFDYLGAANSVYAEEGRIQSYADAHNITIVDEMVEQAPCEFEPGSGGCDPSGTRSDFYIYEDDFRINLDPMEMESRPASNNGTVYDDAPYFFPTSHYLYTPAKVKTRRVVVMNYYGIAISDRLILTPGYDGDQTSLVDNQQYELINKRGQAKHVYDPSWVAVFREQGHEFVKDAGRVLVELFGGHEGWYSVLRGIAWGSGGGNLYNQQCKTPEVVDDVPVQRVKHDQLSVIGVTQHFERWPNGEPENNDPVRDMPEVEASYYQAITADVFGTHLNDPAETIGEQACKSTEDAGCDCSLSNCYGENGNCYDYLDGIDLRNQDPVEVTINVDSIAEEDGVSVVRYAYAFHDETNQQEVKWKWRWQEAVSPGNGGTGWVALEIWYFDENGQIRFHGRGSGDGAIPPASTHQFYITYYGYDEMGRLAVQLEDVDPAATNLPFPDNLSDVPGPLTRHDPNGAGPTNLITRFEFNDAGQLETRLAGFTNNPNNFVLDPSNPDHDVIRTDFKFIPNRQIRYKDSNDNWQQAWQDPYTYQIEYQYVSRDPDQDCGQDCVDQVHGTTTVNIFDSGGKFIEQRIIGWNSSRTSMADKITGRDFGWAISLSDYTYDGAIDDWKQNENLLGDHMPGDLWNCSLSGPPCVDENGLPELAEEISPSYPGFEEVWPPAEEDQIVTLGRSFRLYKQRSSLKPTHEVVYRDFSDSPGSAEPENDQRAVVREMAYDLEDRIARQKDSDGSITRFLFDAKRRPTKIFRGSKDDCNDWFPLGQGSGDDMLLAEQRLYNDGELDCEHSDIPGVEGCMGGTNDNFPNNADRLVRTRRFSGNAEKCDSAYQADTPSRDTRFKYDRRGRPVIAIEAAVGHGGGTVPVPAFISATTTVYDNLDRPRFVATWSEYDVPDVATVESWAGLTDGTTATAILQAGPLTLAETRYDERGRPFEQRTYHVGFGDGSMYTYTRTYRDDLDRVVAELSPSGLMVNKYDPLGRVIETSHWTKEKTAAADRGQPDDINGIELTCTQTEYDAFGNVLRQFHYDRKNTTDTGSITKASNPGGVLPSSPSNYDASTSNAIVTFTYNWYDAAKRLAATANFGTNGDHGFVSGVAPDYDPTKPPTWDGTVYSIDSLIVDGDALITRYGYDAAGRRIWTQDPKGIVTRTWHDLLGRTLLEAENWKDFGGNSGPPTTTQPNGSDLTPNHSGPIRYTAYHYTRGGLMDMMVAIIPTDDDADITPGSINWNENSSNDYAAGTDVSVAGATQIQATRYVYGGDILPEVTQFSDTYGGPISAAPNLVSEIHYPSDDTSDPGQPDAGDKVSFSYLLDGRLAQRTDQRGVTLSYQYGTVPTSPPDTSLHRVLATGIASPVDDTIISLIYKYDEQGRLIAANSNGSDGSLINRVNFEYDLFGNLTKEELDPHNDSNQTKETLYDWAWYTGTTVPTMRLKRITYPSGRIYQYLYGTGSGTPEHAISRITGLMEENGPHVIQYELTGGGRVKRKLWGPNVGTSGSGTVSLDFANGGLDRFGRIKSMAFMQHTFDGTNDGSSLIHGYAYTHDSNGNLLSAWIVQAGHINDRSYRYGYDAFNRLIHAEYGKLLSVGDGFTEPATGRTWKLDLLGNWSGGDSATGSIIDYSANAVSNNPIGFDGNDTLGPFYHHDVAPGSNQLDRLYVGNDPQATRAFQYDAAGNLTLGTPDGYSYDAFGRVVEVSNGSGVVAQYYRDALGRRVNKKVYNSGYLDTVDAGDFYYYDGDRIIEYYRTVEVTDDDDDDGGGGGSIPLKSISDAGEQPSKSVMAVADKSEQSDTGEQSRTRKEADLEQSRAREGAVTDATDATTPTPTDHVYQQGKDVASPLVGGEATPGTDVPEKESTVNYAVGDPPSTYELIQKGEFVYGTEYIDEYVATYSANGNPVYILQDANYNVVGKTNAAGTVFAQMAYTPYGELLAVEDGNGAAMTINYSEPLFQGRWLDLETGLYDFRARLYDPVTGRFLGPDPNGQALHLATALRMNAQTPAAFASLTPSGQYSDGMHFYQFMRSNPNTGRDPSGMFSYPELLSTTAIQASMGGMINGLVAKFAGGDFWEGFATGAIGGALGGGAGYAFAASRAGFVGSAVLGRAIEGFAEEAGASYYSSQDLGAAVVDGLYGSVMSVATGGLFSLGKREVGALAAIDGTGNFGGTVRRGATRPAFGPGSFRDDLAKYWDMPAPPGHHAHHVFPLEHADKFRAAGIDPEDVRFGAWWEAGDHLDNWIEYNEIWRVFLQGSPTMEQILEKGRRLSGKYGLSIAF